MTITEARAVLTEPFPDLMVVMALSSDDWRALVWRNREALRVVQADRSAQRTSTL